MSDATKELLDAARRHHRLPHRHHVTTEETMPTIDQEFMRVTYLDDEATKQAVFDRVMAYFTKHQAFDGESIHQRDSTTIDAPCVLADIADNIIRFQVEYKE